ncbi:MAG: hypothetical protein C0610_16750 [Desulfobacteraceae bacterium]|nr:MAG: hypothetical protein C0610_16750 [Desulfobacteraceae bacterium]
MKYKYPHTQAMLGADSRDALIQKLKHVEAQLEAAYWASGQWLTLGYDDWLESLHEESPRTGA